MITRPFIYDEDNFTIKKSQEKKPTSAFFYTSGNVPIIVFAKPKQCEEGTYTLYTFHIL